MRIKKVLKISGLLLFIIFILSACHTSTGPIIGGNESHESEVEELNTESEQQSEGETSQDMTAEVAPTGDFDYNLSSVVQGMAITEKGYYYIADSIMYFYDLENDISIPMCSRTNCSHITSKCDGYAVSSYDTELCICAGQKLFYYNDKLYMVEQDNNRCTFLCRYDSSFNNKEKIVQLSQYTENKFVTDCRGAFTILNGYFYYYTRISDPDRAKDEGYLCEYNCMRVEMKKGATPEKIGSFEYSSDHAFSRDDSNGNIVLTDGTDIYYVAGHYMKWYSVGNEMEYILARYSANENTFEILDSFKGDRNPDAWGDDIGLIVCSDQSVCMAEDGIMYGITDTGIASINLKTGARKKIYSTPYDGISPSSLYFELQNLVYDDNCLYFIEEELGESDYLTAIDTNGNLIRRYKFEFLDSYKERVEASRAQGWISDYPTRNIKLLGVADDNILVKATENAYKNLTGYGTSFDKKIDFGVGMIDTSDFLGNKKIEIKQIYAH